MTTALPIRRRNAGPWVVVTRGTISTVELAAIVGVSASMIRRTVREDGAYLGLTPIAAKAGLLLWPLRDLEAIGLVRVDTPAGAA